MGNPVQEWRKAYPEIEIGDVPLAQMAPFPSLAVNDYAHYIERRYGATDMVSFIKDISREIAWVYGNWQKAQRDSNAVKLLDDLERAISSGSDQSIALIKLIRDYRRENNLLPPTSEAHPWQSVLDNVISDMPLQPQNMISDPSPPPKEELKDNA